MKILFTSFLLLSALLSAAQVNTAHSLRFLEIGRSARETALGGKAIALADDDLNLAIYTPSLLTDKVHGQLAFNYVNYFSDINLGYIAYAHKLKHAPLILSGAIRFADYGTFTSTDEAFNESGEFSASDLVIQGGASWSPDSTFCLGANLKFVQSAYEAYKSTAVATDVSATYFNRPAQFAFTLQLTNLGVVLQDYTGTDQSLPFDIAVGFSKKLAKSPLKFNVMADNLTQWDLTYPESDPVIDPFTGQPQDSEGPGFSEKFFRHIYGGIELVLSKNLYFRTGYNYRRRQELMITEKPATAGFSWGLGFRVSKFHFSYARAKYHLLSPVNTFTISTNLNTFGKN